MKLTDQDMLTEVVKRGSDGGYTSKKMCTEGEQSSNKYYIIKDTVYFEFREDSIPSSKPHSLPDLIADHEFMKAVYPDDGYCYYNTTCGYRPLPSSRKGCDLKDTCGKCIALSIYRALEALKLLHAGENAVQYLFDNLPEATK